MNKVILIGRLTADPETMTAQSGTEIARYRLAVDRQFKKDGQPTADFISCIAFGKNAEFVGKYLQKGTKIAIEGKIQTGSYEKDGVKHYTTDIVVNHHEFCESKKAASDSGYSAPSQGFAEIDDSEDGELPF